MFSGKTNDGYYELGLETAKLIRDAVMLGRGLVESEESEITSSEDTLDPEQELNLVDV